VIAPLLLALLLLGGWEAYADLGPVDSLLLPAPHQVAQALLHDRSLLASNLLVTGEEIVLGMALALAGALVLSALVHLSDIVRRAAYPLVAASQTVPVVIVAPLLVVWLGYDLAPKLALVALVCFLPIVISTLDGLASVDPELLKLMRTLGASRWQTLWRVEAPSSLPYVFSGLRIALIYAPIAAVLAEPTPRSSSCPSSR
jgi:NitT/TauT family transport system permease protein/putative hydroxymethylpyrimidine transport system permease protein